MPPVLGGGLVEKQYTFQEVRSTEISLADLDEFVGGNFRVGYGAFLVGLIVAGAFDGA